VSILKKRHLELLEVAKKKARNMKMFLAVLILTFAIFPFPIQMAQGAEKEILLLHTNSVKGHLFPCPT
jgi:hypothetical protein